MIGLPVALREICRQVGSQHEIEIELTADEVPSRLPEDLALCFYRVAQEALNNSVKHSAATRAEVRIAACDGTLKMTIKDDGTGFDLAVAARGLGLATMRERLRLVGGELVVSSKFGEGTEIMAQAKLNPPLSQTAAA
jgi:signal transduction histidine kinase